MRTLRPLRFVALAASSLGCPARPRATHADTRVQHDARASSEAPRSDAVPEGSYAPAAAAGPTTLLVLGPGGRYRSTLRGVSVPLESAGRYAATAERVEFTPEGAEGGAGPMGQRALVVRRHAGHVVLLLDAHRDAFDLLPTLRLGLVSNAEALSLMDPALAIPTENPADPASPSARMPTRFSVHVHLPGADANSHLNLTVEAGPHNVHLDGCITAGEGGCRESIGRTLGVGAWAELNRRWWAALTPVNCPVSSPAPARRTFRIGTIEGQIPIDRTEGWSGGPCFPGVALAQWFIDRFRPEPG